ncbi:MULTISPECIES: hypothetical protein [unclassified Microcystis]|uniref:hypothetical protein n=1 Tax=unclassified Microcystis TaxID=2643300 RepID=UPI00257C3FFD|nr:MULTISPECIES: hypothetical protein [unclassified Microcystis]MCA2926014.1 hypothetical protein [Microcystis sp. M020S1]MCA2933354.1 hypothetical protein [Microcystis sp. M015S1]MCA2618566.1 hypothetical protein [Microcystis sp. M099S2]MCA2648719.1 hypothetical protein [Microcystis sp. M065S2]MCA2681494.1 hypothetical protein [Microcystis sp. M043S2]
MSGFIIKIILISALISLGIKYLAPLLSIAPSPLNTLILVFTPFLLMVFALWRRTITD